MCISIEILMCMLIMECFFAFWFGCTLIKMRWENIKIIKSVHHTEVLNPFRASSLIYTTDTGWDLTTDQSQMSISLFFADQMNLAITANLLLDDVMDDEAGMKTRVLTN